MGENYSLHSPMLNIRTRIFSCFLVIGAVAMTSSYASAAFTDVSKSHPNYDAIMYVQSENIVKGYADGSYKPDQKINRAEFTKIIVEAVVGQEPLEHAGQCFPDVKTGMWFYSYVCYAERMGILGGYPDGFFKPANDINFVEAAKIIAIAFEYQTSTDTQVWFKGYVDALGNFHAIPASVSAFEKTITRGEMAEIIYRLKTQKTDKTYHTYDTIQAGSAALKEEIHTEEPREELDGEDETHTEFPDSKDPICIDNCGDGWCQDVTCQGSDCPCHETQESCPADCLQAPEEETDTTVLPTLIGTFTGQSGHSVSGSVEIVNENGQRKVVLGEDFQTQSGPDLYVYINEVANPQSSSELGTRLELLSSFNGRQEFIIPNDNTMEINSVTIFCLKYETFFGTAPTNNSQ